MERKGGGLSGSSAGGGPCSQHAALAASLSASSGNELALTTEDAGLLGESSNLQRCRYLLQGGYFPLRVQYEKQLQFVLSAHLRRKQKAAARTKERRFIELRGCCAPASPAGLALPAGM